MGKEERVCDVIPFRRVPAALERLEMMRMKYNRGDYELLIIVGITHDGDEERIELKGPGFYVNQPKPTAVPINGRVAPLAMLSRFRDKYDSGGYRSYVAIGTFCDGRMDRIRLFPPAQYRLLSNQ